MDIAIYSPGSTEDNQLLQPWSYMRTLASALAAQGHDVRYYSDRYPGELDRCQVKRVSLTRLLRETISPETPLVLPISGGIALRISQLGKRFTSPRSIIGIYLGPYYSATELARLLHPPLVLDPAAAVVPHLLDGVGFSLLRGSRLDRLFSRVLVLSKRDFSLLRGVGFRPDKITLARHPAPLLPNERKPVMRPPRETDVSASAGRSSSVVLFAGPRRFSRGYDLVLRAARMMGRGGTHTAEFVLLCRTDSPKPKTRLRSFGRVRVLEIEGLLTPAAMEEWYRQSTIALLPFRSVASSVPSVLLESQAFGLPIITTNDPVVAEYTSPDGGIRLPVPSVRAMNDALEVMLTDDDTRSKMGAASRRFIMSLPTWHELAGVVRELAEPVESFSGEL